MRTAGDYAGDLDPSDALEVLRTERNAVLVDVRTRAEWSFVGIPDLSDLGKEPVLLEWQSYPDMRVNPDFVGSLKAELAKRKVPDSASVLFLCRSGARSRSAACALTAEGWSNCLNIAGGFEGAPDSTRHRGTVEGWKACGLPWMQS